MKFELLVSGEKASGSATGLTLAGILMAFLGTAACASNAPPAPPAFPSVDMSTTHPNPDPRVGLRAGTMVRSAADTTRLVIGEPAAEAAWNLRLLTAVPAPQGFRGVTNSDLAFTGNLAIQGNYNGFQVWDISTPATPTLKTAYLCPASQSDVSVYRNLLFVSGEGNGGRLDCGTQGVREPTSPERLRGIRIFDISDITRPRYIGNVQTCRGSHTHTVVVDPNDNDNVYLYVSGSAGVRSPEEMPGCSNGQPAENPNTALFRIEVIQVPLAAPDQAQIVTSPRIFDNLVAPPRHFEPDAPAGGQPPAPAPPGPRPGPSQCHDITVYPEIGLGGGACGGYGLLLDIRDVKNPRRIYAAADSNFSYWHSATFSNDGTKLLFSDEWGGGTAPRCRATDKYEWGADAIFRIENGQLNFTSYYKMPAAQTTLENCVAHNGSLIPIPGREVMVQGWYQGGISVFDWTDPTRPVEIAFFDRGPIDSGRARGGGSWSAYWYNGYIYNSEIARGFEVYELMPSGFLTQNEIDAAKTIQFDYWNVQGQQKFVWPPSFALARAYLDQLGRSNGLAAERIAVIRNELARIERLPLLGERRPELSALANQVIGEAQTAPDQAKVRALAITLSDLATAQR